MNFERTLKTLERVEAQFKAEREAKRAEVIKQLNEKIAEFSIAPEDLTFPKSSKQRKAKK